MEARLGELVSALEHEDAPREAFTRLEEYFVVRRLWRELTALFAREAPRRAATMDRYWQRLAEELRLIAETVPLAVERSLVLVEAAKVWERELDRFDQAIASCREAVRGWPGNRDALRVARRNYEKTGEMEFASRLLKLEMKVVGEGPLRDRLELLAAQARLEALYLGRRDQAVAALEAMEALDAEHPWTVIARGWLGRNGAAEGESAGARILRSAGRAGAEAELVDAACTLLDDAFDSDRAQDMVRAAAASTGRYAEAAERVEKTLARKEARSNVGLARLAGELRSAEGALDAAEPHWRRVRLADARDADSLRFFATHYRRKEDWRRLQQILQSLLEAEPEDAPALEVELAHLIEYQLATPTRAIEIWSGILRRDAEREDARVALRRLLAETGGWTRLLELLKDEIPRTADAEDRVEILAEIATIYERHLGMAGLAVSTWNEVLAVAPDHRAAHRAAAQRHAEAGETDEAVAAWKRVYDAPRASHAERVEAARAALAVLEARGSSSASLLPWYAALLELEAVGADEIESLILLGEDGEEALAVAAAARLHRVLLGGVENEVDELRLALGEATAVEAASVVRRCLEALAERNAAEPDELREFADELAASGDARGALRIQRRLVALVPDEIPTRQQAVRAAIAIDDREAVAELIAGLPMDGLVDELVELALTWAWRAQDHDRAATIATTHGLEREYFDRLVESAAGNGIDELHRAATWAREVLDDREDELEVITRLVAARPGDLAVRERYEELLAVLGDPARLAESIQVRLTTAPGPSAGHDALRLAAIYGEQLDAHDAAWRAAVVAVRYGRSEAGEVAWRFAQIHGAEEDAAHALAEWLPSAEDPENARTALLGFVDAALDAGASAPARVALEAMVDELGDDPATSERLLRALEHAQDWDGLVRQSAMRLSDAEDAATATRLAASLQRGLDAGIDAAVALPAVRDLPARFPDTPALLAIAARVLEASGSWTEALDAWERLAGCAADPGLEARAALAVARIRIEVTAAWDEALTPLELAAAGPDADADATIDSLADRARRACVDQGLFALAKGFSLLLESRAEARGDEERLADLLNERVDHEVEDDDRAVLWARIAALRVSLGRVEDAFDAARAAIVLGTSDMAVVAVVRDAASALGLWSDARLLLEDVEVPATERRAHAVWLARAAMQSGEEDAAARHVDEAFDAASAEGAADATLAELADLAFEVLLPDRAAAACVRGLAPMDGPLRSETLRALVDRADGDAAQTLLHAAVDADPSSRDAMAQYESVLLQAGDWHALAAALEASTAVLEGEERIEQLRKVAMLRQSRLEDASAALDAWMLVCSADPNDDDAWIRVLELAEPLGRKEERRAALEALRRVGDADRQALAALALVEDDRAAGADADALLAWLDGLDPGRGGVDDALDRIERETGSRAAWERLDAWLRSTDDAATRLSILERRAAADATSAEERAELLGLALDVASDVAPHRVEDLLWARFAHEPGEVTLREAVEVYARSTQSLAQTAAKFAELAEAGAAGGADANASDGGAPTWRHAVRMAAGRLWAEAGDADAALAVWARAAGSPDGWREATDARLALLETLERWSEWLTLAGEASDRLGDEAPLALLEGRVRVLPQVSADAAALETAARAVLARAPASLDGLHALARAHIALERPADALASVDALEAHPSTRDGSPQPFVRGELYAQAAELGRAHGDADAFAGGVRGALRSGIDATVLADGFLAAGPLPAALVGPLVDAFTDAVDADRAEGLVEAFDAVMEDASTQALEPARWRAWAEALAPHAACASAALSAQLRAIALESDAATLRAEATGALDAADPSRVSWIDVADVLETLVDESEGDEAREGALLRTLAEVRAARVGDHDGALEAWSRVLAVDPDDEEANEATTTLLSALERWDDVVEHLRERALSSSDDAVQADLLARTAQVLAEHLGRPEDALATARMALEADAQHAAARRAVATILRAREDWEELVALLEQLTFDLSEGEEHDTALAELASIRSMKLGDHAGALDAWRRLLASPTGQAAGRAGLASALDAAAAGRIEASWGLLAAEMLRPHLATEGNDAEWEALLGFTAEHGTDAARRADDRLAWLQIRERLGRESLADDVMRSLAAHPSAHPIAEMLLALAPEKGEAARILELSVQSVPDAADRGRRLALAASALDAGMERARLLSRAAVESQHADLAEQALAELLAVDARPQAVGLLLALADGAADATGATAWLDRALALGGALNDDGATLLMLHERLVDADPSAARRMARRDVAARHAQWHVVDEELSELVVMAADENEKVARSLELAKVRLTSLDDPDGALQALDEVRARPEALRMRVEVLAGAGRTDEAIDAHRDLLLALPDDMPARLVDAVAFVNAVHRYDELLEFVRMAADAASEQPERSEAWADAARAIDELTQNAPDRLAFLEALLPLAATTGADRLRFELLSERVDRLDDGEEKARAAEIAARFASDAELRFLLLLQACADETVTPDRVRALAGAASAEADSDDRMRVLDRFLFVAQQADDPSVAAELASEALEGARDVDVPDAIRMPLLELATATAPLSSPWADAWVAALEARGEWATLDDHLERCRAQADEVPMRARLSERLAAIRADHLDDTEGALEALEGRIAEGGEGVDEAWDRVAELALRLDDAGRTTEWLERVAQGRGRDADWTRAVRHALDTLNDPPRAADLATQRAFVTEDETLVEAALDAFRAATAWTDFAAVAQRGDIPSNGAPALRLELADVLARELDDRTSALRIVAGLADEGSVEAAHRWLAWAEEEDDARETLAAIDAVLVLDDAADTAALVRRKASLLDEELGDEAAAEPVWREVLANDPTDAWAWDRVMEAARLRGDRDAVLADVATIERAPLDPAVRGGLLARAVETLAVDMGATEEANALGLRVLAQDATGPLIERMLHLAEEDAARRALVDALGPHVVDDESAIWVVAAQALVTLLVALDRSDEALPLALDLADRRHLSERSALAFAEREADGERWENAARLVSAISGEGADALVLRARVTEGLQGPGAAVRSWEAAAAHPDAPLAALTGLGRALRLDGRVDDALPHLQRAVLNLAKARSSDEKVVAYEELGHVHRALGDEAKAERDFRQAEAHRRR